MNIPTREQALAEMDDATLALGACVAASESAAESHRATAAVLASAREAASAADARFRIAQQRYRCAVLGQEFREKDYAFQFGILTGVSA